VLTAKGLSYSEEVGGPQLGFLFREVIKSAICKAEHLEILTDLNANRTLSDLDLSNSHQEKRIYFLQAKSADEAQDWCTKIAGLILPPETEPTPSETTPPPAPPKRSRYAKSVDGEHKRSSINTRRVSVAAVAGLDLAELQGRRVPPAANTSHYPRLPITSHQRVPSQLSLSSFQSSANTPSHASHHSHTDHSQGSQNTTSTSSHRDSQVGSHTRDSTITTHGRDSTISSYGHGRDSTVSVHDHRDNQISIQETQSAQVPPVPARRHQRSSTASSIIGGAIGGASHVLHNIAQATSSFIPGHSRQPSSESVIIHNQPSTASTAQDEFRIYIDNNIYDDHHNMGMGNMQHNPTSMLSTPLNEGDEGTEESMSHAHSGQEFEEEPEYDYDSHFTTTPRREFWTLRELWDFHHVLLELYSATCVFLMYLVTLESILVSALSAGVTYFYCRVEIGDHKFAGNLSWTFISFAVVFPLTYSYGEAFKRREQALGHIAGLKTNLCWLYMAHRDWFFGTDTSRGRLGLGEGHIDEVLRLMLAALVEMRKVLCLPTTRTRHVITRKGTTFAQMVKLKGRTGALKVIELFQGLSRKVEDMKLLGLPGPEAATMRQVSMSALDHWEHLNKIKMYRTPQSTRSFARIFIWIHPFFFGPYYSFIAGGLKSDEAEAWTNEWFAMSLSILTTMAMMGLFNIRYALEDPFNEREGLLDAIHTRAEFEDMKAALLVLTPEHDPIIQPTNVNGMTPQMLQEQERLRLAAQLSAERDAQRHHM